jgi:peptide/nickel transport system permease protein
MLTSLIEQQISFALALFAFGSSFLAFTRAFEKEMVVTLSIFKPFIGWARKKWSSPAARKLRRNKLAWVGLAIVSVVLFFVIFADFVAPYDPIEIVGNPKTPPSGQFLLGTDDVGRDILSRIIHAVRLDLMLGLLLVGMWTAIGVPLGLIAGYFGGKIDSIIMRTVDGLYAFPYLVFAVAMAGLFRPGVDIIIIAVGIIGWPLYARVVRGKTLEVKAEDYVEAARAFGEKDKSIIRRYVFPNCLAPIIVVVTLGLPIALIIVSALAYLGLAGLPLHVPELGSMLAASQPFMRETWWWPTFTGLAIVIIVLGFNFLGDGLRDAFDPRLRY